MIVVLRLLFLGVLLSMLAVTSWASLHCPLFGVPKPVATHPWFIATLFDAYFGFITFYVWVCFKQVSLAARVAWLVAILLLGNIAMSAYCLSELLSVKKDASLVEVLTAKRGGQGLLGWILAAAGLAVVGLALR